MNARAERLLHVLCVCVRLLSRGQAMRLLDFRDEANFKRFVRELAARGLVSEITVWAKPVPELREPLLALSWARGKDANDAQGLVSGAVGRTVGESVLNSEDHLRAALERVLHLARLRWSGVAAVPTPCILATKRAGRLYGVDRNGFLVRPTQATHDSAVSECAVHILADPSRADHLRGEDFADFTPVTKRPDLVLLGTISGDRGVRTAVEVVGADYKLAGLVDLHRELQTQRIDYELW